MKTKNHSAEPQKTAYSYRRFSSRAQGDGSSLERQQEMAKSVCAANGWKLVDLPPDAGVSAFKVTSDDGLMAANMHKGNLGAFLERVQGGNVKKGSVLIVERLDRFSRNYFDIVFPVWLSLLQSGVEIYSCVSGTHYTLANIRKNPMMAGMALMEMAQANDYSANLSNRVTKANVMRIANASKGKSINLGGWVPRWLEFSETKGQEGAYTLNAHADTVRRIVNDYLQGKSMWAIARGLIADKVPCINGGTWSQGQISPLLKTEALIGTANVKGTSLKKYFPAIISDKQWAMLKAMLAANSSRKGGSLESGNIATLFRNRCRCAKCGGAVNTTRKYHHCSGLKKGTCNVHGNVRVDRLELDFFVAMMQHPAALIGKANVKHNGAQAAIKARISDVDVQIDAATNLLGKLPISQLEAKLTALVKEKEALGRELEKSNATMLSAVSAPTAFDDIKRTLSALAKVPDSYAGSKQEAATVAVIAQLRGQLEDAAIRRKLLGLLPTLVGHLVIDLEGKRYQVVNHAGERLPWRRLG
jgi:DNA invertase Pin-like site-specific DNA recombinase